jgi:hypothetical protein
MSGCINDAGVGQWCLLMPMCGPSCACRLCDLTKMAWHPDFKARVGEMIHEYKRKVIGSSYFPIEIMDAKEGGQ